MFSIQEDVLKQKYEPKNTLLQYYEKKLSGAAGSIPDPRWPSQLALPRILNFCR